MDDLRPLSYGIITVLYTIAMATIMMRIWVRGFAMNSFGWDDWAMAAQLIFFSCQQAILYYFLIFGGGMHLPTLLQAHPEYMTFLLKGLLVEEYWYIFMQFSIKMCFLLFFFRLSKTSWFIWCLWATIGWNIATTIAIWLLYSFQCPTLAAFYEPAKYPDVKCLSSSITYFIPYSLNLFTDVLILVLPIPTIWSLNMSINRRVAVLAVLTTGGAAVLTSALRAIILFQFSSSPDFTWSLGKMIIISNIEMSVAIVAANMPALKAFWTCWRHNRLGPGQGESLADGSGPRDPVNSNSSRGYELGSKVKGSKVPEPVEMGRPSRLPSSESEEELWETRKQAQVRR